jgi:hypothetical protein
MGDLFRRGAATFVAGFVGATVAWSGLAQAQSEPPGRVGRLAFTNGTVSFHDNEQSDWAPAAVNTPLSTGDSLWTEPNARSEISLAGTRIRMAGATELDMLAVDDTQTRLQVDQGRVDIKTQAMDTSQPYQIVTPRGTISLLQQGDYYVEAGSTQDPTQIGVRAGAAQIQGLNGQVLAVRPGEVGEVTGDAATPQLRTIHSAPPPQPAVWADRDRQVSYDQPPQYLTAGVTGYEDLNQYGTWVDDSSYGEVWIPRSVPAGWAPYRTGHWAYEQPWGWAWIDDQPWGFAPYHYGRWANREGRWMWLPPQRDARPVYAPALVAFVGGVELSAALSRQSSAPVGWFPLGPREAYVPPYTTNHDYYQRINRPARVEDQVLNDRWQRAERHEPAAGQNQPQNQPHAALMNQRFATVVPAATFVHSQPVARAALQVAPDKIAAAPVAPVAAPPAPAASVAAPQAQAAPNAAKPSAAPAPAPATTNLATAKTAVADMPTFARPAALQAPAAPGPKFAATRPTAPATDSKQALPALAPRQGTAPPELKGAVTPAPSTPATSQPAKPGAPPTQQQATPQPQSQPHSAPAAEPNHPPVPAPQQQARPEPPKPAEAPHQQAAPQPPAAHPQPPQANQPQHPAEPLRQQAAPQPPAQANQPPHPVEAPRPQAVPQPQPQHQPAPAQEGHAAPQPQQQPHPAPQPQQVQAPRPAPEPPHPAPQPQPQQAQAPHPAPQPQQQQQPHPAPPPPQAQAPHPASQPQQQQKQEEKK